MKYINKIILGAIGISMIPLLTYAAASSVGITSTSTSQGWASLNPTISNAGSFQNTFLAKNFIGTSTVATSTFPNVAVPSLGTVSYNSSLVFSATTTGGYMVLSPGTSTPALPHGTAVSNAGNLYVGSISSNQIRKYDPANLYGPTTLISPAGTTGGFASVINDSVNNKIYAITGSASALNIVSIDPSTDAVTNIINSGTIVCNGACSIGTDGTYIFGITQESPAHVFRVKISDGTLTTVVFTGANLGHTTQVVTNASSTEAYFTTQGCNFAKLDHATGTMSLRTSTISAGTGNCTDDMAAIPVNNADALLYIGREGTGPITQLDSNSLAQTVVPHSSYSSYGMFYENGNLFNTSPSGVIEEWVGGNLNNYLTFTATTNKGGQPNELLYSGGKYFYTEFTSSKIYPANFSTLPGTVFATNSVQNNVGTSNALYGQLDTAIGNNNTIYSDGSVAIGSGLSFPVGTNPYTVKIGVNIGTGSDNEIILNTAGTIFGSTTAPNVSISSNGSLSASNSIVSLNISADQFDASSPNGGQIVQFSPDADSTEQTIYYDQDGDFWFTQQVGPGDSANISSFDGVSTAQTSSFNPAANGSLWYTAPTAGFGTTTPGTQLSVGNLNGINFSEATSTFNSTGGININHGCYAYLGTCLSSGGANFFTASGVSITQNTGSNLTTGNVTATSTATSTFPAISIGGGVTGGISLNYVTPPTNNLITTPSGSGGTLASATYKYWVSYVLPDGSETQLSALAVNAIVTGPTGSVALTNIPLSTDPRVTGRHLYRGTTGNGNQAPWTIIADNTTTSFTDDGSITVLNNNQLRLAAGVNYGNNTGGKFYDASTSQLTMSVSEDGLIHTFGSHSGLIIPAQSDATTPTQQFRQYNTSDETNNSEFFSGYWQSNIYTLGTIGRGSGAARELRLQSSNASTNFTLGMARGGADSTSNWFNSVDTGTSNTNLNFVSYNPVAWTGSGGVNSIMNLGSYSGQAMTMTQSGSAGYNILNIDLTEATLGTGVHNFVNFKIAGVTKFQVDHSGATGIATTSKSAMLTIQAIAASSTLNVASSTGATDLGVDSNDRVVIGTAGTVVLSSGVKVVTPNVPIDSNTIPFIQELSSVGTCTGVPEISATTSTTFTITSSVLTDNCMVGWFIIEKYR